MAKKNREIERVVEDLEQFHAEQPLFEHHGAADDALGYVRFYADRQNQLMAAFPDMWERDGMRWQFEYLRKQGLARTDRFLEYGCGSASAGKHVIDYLEPGKYVGVDISSQSIEIGREIIRQHGLDAKAPALHVLPDGAVDCLAGLQFDVIWAQSVLTHTPPPVTEQILANVAPLLAPEGRFFSTIARIESGIRQVQFHRWYYDIAYFEETAPRLGYDLRVLDDWEHPHDGKGLAEARDTMLLFTRA